MSYQGTGMGGSSGGMGRRRTITAFFDDRREADRAVDRLYSAGFAQSDVRLVPGSGGSGASTTTVTQQSQGGGGFFDALADLFLPDDDRHTYAEGLSRGGYLVTVTATDANYERAVDILDDEGTIDMDQREASWRQEGWTGRAGLGSATSTTGMGMGSSGSSYGSTGAGTGMGTGSAGSSHSGASSSTGTEREEVIPVAEEQLRVGKRDVNQGRVRVRSYVVETPVSEQVNLREEHARVERRPADRALGTGENLFQERTIEVEEHGEEAVVSKEARVREEIVVGKTVENRTQTVSDTLRSTEVEIEDDRTTGTGTSRTTTDRDRSGF